MMCTKLPRKPRASSTISPGQPRSVHSIWLACTISSLWCGFADGGKRQTGRQYTQMQAPVQLLRHMAHSCGLCRLETSNRLLFMIQTIVASKCLKRVEFGSSLKCGMGDTFRSWVRAPKGPSGTEIVAQTRQANDRRSSRHSSHLVQLHSARWCKVIQNFTEFVSAGLRWSAAPESCQTHS